MKNNYDDIKNNTQKKKPIFFFYKKETIFIFKKNYQTKKMSNKEIKTIHSKLLNHKNK